MYLVVGYLNADEKSSRIRCPTRARRLHEHTAVF